jgi:hypothetical protein
VTGRFLGKIPFACIGTLSATGTHKRRKKDAYAQREAGNEN